MAQLIKANDNPIEIFVDSISDTIRKSINPNRLFNIGISTNIRLHKKTIEKYNNKRLTIEDLNKIIKLRK